MLTKQARCVLRGLKKLTGNTDALFSRTLGGPAFVLMNGTEGRYDFSKYEDEIDSILLMLLAEGLIRNIDHGMGLTQTGIHFCQFRWHRALRYIGENWISFFALVVAVIALCVSLSPSP